MAASIRRSFLGLVLGLTGLATAGNGMEGYIVCGACNYFDPATRSCHQAADCWASDGYRYDCGHCATWFDDSWRGHCETILGCGGATSKSWPQVLYGENQAQVARD